ncbi:MAG: amidohydrolase family protein, partial [Gemmatirosa sp.]
MTAEASGAGAQGAGASGANASAVSLAVVNARVWTGNPRRPWADAVAVQGERLAAVGSSAEVRKLAGPAARVIDAGGQFLVPGFIDAHVHFVEGGFGLTSVQLKDARTRDDFVRRIKEHAARLPAGAW